MTDRTERSEGQEGMTVDARSWEAGPGWGSR
jgi:hypothetical protein